MIYQGEHTSPGIFGQTCLYLSLGALAFSLLLFVLRHKNQSLLTISKAAWILHLLAAIGSVSCLLYIILNHYYEYHQVWQYTSNDLPLTYQITALWAGREGSLLLWLLLQGLWGSFLIFKKNAPSAAVVVVLLAQVLFNIILLGIQIGDVSLGQSPFILLRELTDYRDMPLFSDPFYLQYLKDGNGLNPLLRNPWMAIHPPLLFLGYSACLLPYAYSFSALRRAKVETKIPLHFIGLALLFLGAGLILGGAWAYEDLSFGGFWAWDPVENASLVPWLLLLAGLHFLLSGKFKQGTLIFSMAPYIAVLFAAYLTRSGVLSRTSAHSFSEGEGGMSMLLICVVFILAPLIYSLWPKQRSSEMKIVTATPGSKDYLMFGAASLMILSAFQIFFVTAVPAFNQWFSINIASPIHAEEFYNDWQIWFAWPALFLMGISTYSAAGNKSMKEIFRLAWPALAGSAILLILFIVLNKTLPWPRYILLLSLFFALLAALDYFLRIRDRKAFLPANLTHLGFVIFLFGAVYAFSLQEDLTSTQKAEESGQSLLLGSVQPLSGGYISYAGRTVEKDMIRYRLDFLQKRKDGRLYLDYSLYPSISAEGEQARATFPAIKKRISEDIFVQLTYVEILHNGYAELTSAQIKTGDTSACPLGFLIFDSLITATRNISGTTVESAYCRLLIPGTGTLSFQPAISQSNNSQEYFDDTDSIAGISLRLSYPGPEDSAIITMYTRKNDFVLARVRRFPWINLLWAGAALLGIGLLWTQLRKLRRK